MLFPVVIGLGDHRDDVLDLALDREAAVDRKTKDRALAPHHVDVLDLPLVPGCASSEVNGLTYDELRQTLFAIAGAREVIGFDLVEVNPMLDVAADNTSQLAAQLIIEFLGRIVEHPGYRKRHPMRGEAPSRRGAARGRRHRTSAR